MQAMPVQTVAVTMAPVPQGSGVRGDHQIEAVGHHAAAGRRTAHEIKVASGDM